MNELLLLWCKHEKPSTRSTLYRNLHHQFIHLLIAYYFSQRRTGTSSRCSTVIWSPVLYHVFAKRSSQPRAKPSSSGVCATSSATKLSARRHYNKRSASCGNRSSWRNANDFETWHLNQPVSAPGATSRSIVTKTINICPGEVGQLFKAYSLRIWNWKILINIIPINQISRSTISDSRKKEPTK